MGFQSKLVVMNDKTLKNFMCEGKNNYEYLIR